MSFLEGIPPRTRRTDRKTCGHCEASAAGCRSNEGLRGRRCCEASAGNHDLPVSRERHPERAMAMRVTETKAASEVFSRPDQPARHRQPQPDTGAEMTSTDPDDFTDLARVLFAGDDAQPDADLENGTEAENRRGLVPNEGSNPSNDSAEQSGRRFAGSLFNDTDY